MSLLPPPPPPAPVRRPRRWPWVTAVAVLVLALVAAVVTAVDARRDLDQARRQSAALEDQVLSLQDQVDELQRPASGGGDEGNGDAGTGDGSAGDGGTAAPDSPTSAIEDLLKGLLGGEGVDTGQLQDLLEGLLGGGSMSGALEGLDPKCLTGDDPSGVLGGLTKGGGVKGTVEEQVAKIADLVQEERGLTFKGDVQPEFLPADEFDARIAGLVKAEYPVEEADLDGRLLGLLGAVPDGTDMKALQSDVLSGQVAGYYDPDTGDVVVRVPEGQDSLDVNGQVTLAHELDHMLTDQRLGLPDTAKGGDSDANLARLALVEGDATLLMQRFMLQQVGLLDQIGSALSPEAAASQEDLDKVPSYLRNQLLFPYTSGLAYTCRLSADGGWKAVDAAYDDTPLTTAEILFDDRANVAPAATSPVPSPGDGWEEARTDTFGAAPLLWLFQAPGGDEALAIADPKAASARWDGGDLTLFTKGPRSALGLSLVDRQDGGALCDSVRDWYGAAFGEGTTTGAVTTFADGGRHAELRCDGRDVRLGIAPDAATATALAG